MRIDMNKWNEATRSPYYADWSPNARQVCEDVREYPVLEEIRGDKCEVFTFYVRNRFAKNNIRVNLKIALTKDGQLEYFCLSHEVSPKPRWYIGEAIKKTCLLLDAFSRNGFIKEEDNEY